jgi:hypothetical protein
LTSAASTGAEATWLHERVQGRRTIEAPIEVVEYEPNARLTIKSGSKGSTHGRHKRSVQSATTRPR